MSDTITLVTADKPPVSLVASRVHLVANSKVFADMVALPSSSSQDSAVNVAESEKEIKPFLAVLAGEGGKKGGELEKLDEIGWETLARLGDKYDSPAVLSRVETRFWQLEADGRPSPLHSFTLATFLNSRDLLKRTALRALTALDGKQRFGAKSEWKERLAMLQFTRYKLAFELFKEGYANADTHFRAYTTSPALTKAYREALARSFATLEIPNTTLDFVTPWTEAVQSLGYTRVQEGQNALDELARKWAALPEFPYGD
ncbi:hypothetical protein JCM10213_004716 [Rhodosporidiobolus nylandii]